MELPNYFIYFNAVYPTPVVEALVSIESSLHAVNYTKHLDLVDAVFQREGVEDMRSLAENAVEIIRNHVYDAMHMQGITLMNSDETPIIVMALMLNGLVAFATQSIPDLLEGELIDEGESDVEFVCNALAITSGISAPNLMLYIDKVDPHLVEVLMAGETTESVHVVNNQACMDRFKRYWDSVKSTFPTNEEGDPGFFIINTVKSLGYFGYDANSVLKAIDDDLMTLTVEERIRAEITLLILGSSLRDPEEMRTFAEETVESLYQNPQLMLRINARWPNFEEYAL